MAFVPKVTQLVVVAQGQEFKNGFSQVSQWNDALALAANTAKAYDVTAMRVAAGLPAGQPFLLAMKADTNAFYANFHGTAAAVPGDTADGTAPEFNPELRYIGSDITSISFIATATTKLILSVYRP